MIILATWLAHLRVADRLLNEFGFSPREFLAGNLAPDCGEPVPGGFDPPKEITHWTDSGKGHCDYERFRREILAPEQDGNNRTFLIGYFCHLMADVLWVRLINDPTKERFRELYTSDREEYYRRVKPEWYANDFLFLRSSPDFRSFRLFCEINEFPVNCLPYYRADSVEKQIRIIQQYYLSPQSGVTTVVPLADRIPEDFVFLTPQQMDWWVEEAASRIAMRLREGI